MQRRASMRSAGTSERSNDAAARGGDRRRWLTLALVLAAAFMLLVDVTIVNVAIPTIQRDLGASYAAIQLILAVYQLAFACVLVTGGRLGDVYGRRKVFLAALLGFVAASAACGVASSPSVLVASRIVQGLFAGVLYPQVLAIIQVTFDEDERGKAFGIFGTVIGLAVIAGPMAGGALTTWDVLGLSWRPIFLVNVAIGALVVPAAWRWLDESRSPKALRLDVLGVSLLTPALFLLIAPLVIGRELGFPWWTFALLGAAVPLLIAFLVVERRRTERDRSPLLDTKLFRSRAFVVGLLVAFAFFCGLPSFFLTFVLFLQDGLGMSALDAGLTLIPYAAGAAIASAASSHVARRLGRTILSLGTGLLACGMLGLLLTVHLAGRALDGFRAAPALFACGLGLGCFVAPLVNLVLQGIEDENAGSASGVLSTVQRVGGATGVALLGIFFFAMLGGHADASARAELDRVEHALAVRGVSRAEIDRLEGELETCVRARARAGDPSAVPPSCAALGKDPVRGQGGGPPADVRPILTAALRDARARSFTFAIERMMAADAALFALVCGLTFALPQVRRGSRASSGQ